MKSIRYLYEMESFRPHFSEEEIEVICKYITFQQRRMWDLNERGSTVAAQEAAKENGTELFSEISMVRSNRTKGIEFWEEKLKEFE